MVDGSCGCNMSCGCGRDKMSIQANGLIFVLAIYWMCCK